MTPAGTVDYPLVADLWELHAQGHWIVIPVNTQGIHGRGLAKQALDKGFLRYKENRNFVESPLSNRIFTVAVKGHAPKTARVPGKAFSERVTGRNVKLLQSELECAVRLHPAFQAAEFADLPLCVPELPLCVPFLGLGFGEGDPAEILPVLRQFEGPRVKFVKPPPEVAKRYGTAFAPGVREDRFRKDSL